MPPGRGARRHRLDCARTAGGRAAPPGAEGLKTRVALVTRPVGGAPHTARVSPEFAWYMGATWVTRTPAAGARAQGVGRGGDS